MDNPHKTIKNIPLFETSYFTIQHIPSCKAIQYQLKGYLTESEARDFFEKILSYTIETKSNNLIADLSDFKGSHMNLAKYIDQVWSKQLSRAGIKRVARNHPTSKFGAFSNKIASGPGVQANLIIKEFETLDDAVKWVYHEEN